MSDGHRVRARALVRPARATDLETLAGIFNYYVEHTAVTFETAPRTAAVLPDWFAQFDSMDRHQLLVVEDPGHPTGEPVAGYAHSVRFNPRPAYERSVMSSIYLHPRATGRGLGRVLYGALLERLRGTDVHRAYGWVTQPNEPSMALHRALGFREIGRMHEAGFKFDRWWDVRMMEWRAEAP